jgi:spore maturation protein CgeB
MEREFRSGLVISPNFHNYGDIITETLRQRGIDMSHLPFPSREESFPEKVYYYILRHTLYRSHQYGRAELHHKRNREIIESFNKTIPETVREQEPEFVLVIQGSFVKPETVCWIRDKTDATPILWSYDELDRLRLTRQSAKYYKSAYLFVPPQPDEFESVNAKYLPLAHDDRSYNKLDSTDEPPIDIAFIGSLTNERRKDILSHLVQELDANIQIWFPAWTLKDPVSFYRYRIKRRKLSKHINRSFIDHTKINEIYNRSKICLNIHKAWKVNSEEPVGLNMRTFEVPGARGFELVDEVTNLGDHFDIGEELVTYSGTDDLVEKVRYYLENDQEREAIANRGYRRAKDNHTFEDRLNVILQDV